MSNPPQGTPPFGQPLSPERQQELLQLLRRKEGNWVEWGRACGQLQKSGYSTNQLFEETGFEPIQQNQVIVAAQVFDSVVKAGASEALQSYLLGPRSDILYEFRVLNQPQRLAASELLYDKQLTLDEAHEVAKAVKEFARLSKPPESFTDSPGDTVAYQCWKQARQLKDLQERSRLIAKGLKFAQTPSAREQLEKLLSDFTVVPARKAPLMPVYRVEAEEDLPRIVPVAGSFPLDKQAFEAAQRLDAQEPFGIATTSGAGSWVPLPGWQVVAKAEDPVAIATQSDRLSTPLPGPSEPVLVVADRQGCEWDANSYFIVERDGQLDIQWFDEVPEIPLLARVILIVRPRRVFDEEAISEPWQIEE